MPRANFTRAWRMKIKKKKLGAAKMLTSPTFLRLPRQFDGSEYTFGLHTYAQPLSWLIRELSVEPAAIEFHIAIQINSFAPAPPRDAEIDAQTASATMTSLSLMLNHLASMRWTRVILLSIARGNEPKQLVNQLRRIFSNWSLACKAQLIKG